MTLPGSDYRKTRSMSDWMLLIKSGHTGVRPFDLL